MKWFPPRVNENQYVLPYKKNWRKMYIDRQRAATVTEDHDTLLTAGNFVWEVPVQRGWAVIWVSKLENAKPSYVNIFMVLLFGFFQYSSKTSPLVDIVPYMTYLWCVNFTHFNSSPASAWKMPLTLSFHEIACGCIYGDEGSEWVDGRAKKSRFSVWFRAFYEGYSSSWETFIGFLLNAFDRSISH